ncbi:GNAT family N-acetyltransferase [Gordonibacter sp. 28C]|uniref:GNAT family N-acetyltransferase n=1 Tax=Gordonibacter sp. 28C TaxID=2078569 RepID=UPI0018F49A52|nr:GNAT family N-acetyltransferase [Gordonibacter sp. 28C]
MNEELTIRFAVREDAADLLRLTRALAADMGREGEVAATVEDIERGMFGEGAGEALVAAHPVRGVVGCAVFCRTFSTWKGACGVYLEDLFVEEAYRGGGTGRALMARLAALCEERGYERLSWHCRDTNEAGLAFYERLGSARVDPLVLHRLEGEALAALAAQAPTAAGESPAAEAVASDETEGAR